MDLYCRDVFDVNKLIFSTSCLETKQCVEQAVCAPPTGVGKCVCESAFFEDNGKCFKRKLVGERCNEGQCVDKASCTSKVGGQCRCDAGFYQNGNVCAGSKS